MLETYCDWKAIEGVTCHVAFGVRSIDFLVGTTFIEYHPISLKRGFTNPSTFRKLKHAMHQCSPQARIALTEALQDEILEQYIKQRRTIVESCPEYRNYKLIVATTPEEFICCVLKPLANVELPSLPQLERQFKQFKSEFFGKLGKNAEDF